MWALPYTLLLGATVATPAFLECLRSQLLQLVSRPCGHGSPVLCSVPRLSSFEAEAHLRHSNPKPEPSQTQRPKPLNPSTQPQPSAQSPPENSKPSHPFCVDYSSGTESNLRRLTWRGQNISHQGRPGSEGFRVLGVLGFGGFS